MSKKGFTLIEILLAVAIVSVISGLVVVQVNDANNSAKDARRKADIDLIANAIVSYRSENYSKAPLQSNACSIGDGNCPVLESNIEPFLATIPDDPDADKNYVYKTTNTEGTGCLLYATLSNGDIYKYDCSTNKSITATPVPGKCTSYDNVSVSWDPNKDKLTLCDSGTLAGLTHATDWFWTCEGKDTGANANCQALQTNDFYCEILPTCNENEKFYDLFHLYSTDGGHAELNDGGIFTNNRVCCNMGSLVVSNQSAACGANQADLLNLYSATNSHVEEGTYTPNVYTNRICLSIPGRIVTCEYAKNDKGTCSSGNTSLKVSISEGGTNLHVGGESTFPRKVCCKITAIQ